MSRWRGSDSETGLRTPVSDDDLNRSAVQINPMVEDNQDLSDSDSQIPSATDSSEDLEAFEATEAHDEEETTSSDVSTSSGSDSEDGSTADQIPPTKLQTKELQSSDLRSKISAFLPQIAQANQKLSSDGAAARMDDVSENEPHYIEMNLGLGVLKEKSKRKRYDGIRLEETTSSSDTSPSSEDDEEELGENANVLERLQGRKIASKKRKVEELG